MTTSAPTLQAVITNPPTPLFTRGAYLFYQIVDPDTNDITGSNIVQFDCVMSEEWDLDTTITEHPVETGSNITDNVRVSLQKCQLTVFMTNEPLGQNDLDNAELVGQQVSAPLWDSKLAERSAVVDLASTVGPAGVIAGGIVNGLLVAPAVRPQTLIANTYVRDTVGLAQLPGGGVLEGLPQPGLQISFDYVARMVKILSNLKGDYSTLDPRTGQQREPTPPKILKVIGTKHTCDNMLIESLNVHRDVDTGSGATITIGLKEIRFVNTVTVTAPAASLPRAKTPVTKGPQNTSTDPAATQKQSLLSKLYQSTGGGTPPAL